MEALVPTKNDLLINKLLSSRGKLLDRNETNRITILIVIDRELSGPSHICYLSIKSQPRLFHVARGFLLSAYFVMRKTPKPPMVKTIGSR